MYNMPRREQEIKGGPEHGSHLPRPVVVPDNVGLVTRLARSARGIKTRGNFAHDFLPRIGAVPHTHNLVAMMAWMQAEGDAGRFNPINTTLHMAGSTDFNWVHVQNYASYLDGVEATAETLNVGANHRQFGYEEIRHHLRRNSKAIEVLRAVEESAWGTGGLAVRVLEETGWEELLTNRYVHHRLVQ